MKKKIIISIVIFLIILSAFMIWFFGFRNTKKNDSKSSTQNKITIINELSIELGDPVPSVQDFVTETLNNSFKLSFEEYDDSVPFEYTIIYYNPNGNEVTSDEAIEHESLKKDYTSKKIVTSLGEFKVVLKYNNENYYSKLIVKDTTEPDVVLKELTINENENVDINDFVISINDNSKKEVTLSYVSALTDYKEIEKLDLSVGEHNIFIEARDQSNNKVVIQTKLIVNKKQQANNTNNQNTNNSSTNQNNTQSSNTSSNTSQNTTQTQNAWDILGISEYDYYNKPTHDWMRVDIDAKNYSTQEETFNACKNKGENDSPYESYSYMCTPVETHSGKFLGYMLTYTELKP